MGKPSEVVFLESKEKYGVIEEKADVNYADPVGVRLSIKPIFRSTRFQSDNRRSLLSKFVLASALLTFPCTCAKVVIRSAPEVDYHSHHALREGPREPEGACGGGGGVACPLVLETGVDSLSKAGVKHGDNLFILCMRAGPIYSAPTPSGGIIHWLWIHWRREEGKE